MESNSPVQMTRRVLDDLPEFALPEGFGLRWYQPGDEAHWLRIHLAADKLNEITPLLFQRQFGSDTELLSQRQCYLLNSHADFVGTCTAWFNDNFEGARWGRVHWMAILPEFQGRGLGKVLMSAICRRLRGLGHKRAYLTTSAARVTAVNLYLLFGFAPLIRNTEEAAVWRELKPHLKFTWPPAE